MEILLKSIIIVPIILYAVTARLIANSSRKLKNYHECIGTIVRFEHPPRHLGASPEWSNGRTPIIAYAVNGRTYEFFADYYSSTMKVGKKIRIMYSNEDYSKATVKAGLYTAPIITGILAVCFTFAYAVVLIICNNFPL